MNLVSVDQDGFAMVDPETGLAVDESCEAECNPCGPITPPPGPLCCEAIGDPEDGFTEPNYCNGLEWCYRKATRLVVRTGTLDSTFGAEDSSYTRTESYTLGPGPRSFVSPVQHPDREECGQFVDLSMHYKFWAVWDRWRIDDTQLDENQNTLCVFARDAGSEIFEEAGTLTPVSLPCAPIGAGSITASIGVPSIVSGVMPFLVGCESGASGSSCAGFSPYGVSAMHPDAGGNCTGTPVCSASTQPRAGSWESRRDGISISASCGWVRSYSIDQCLEGTYFCPPVHQLIVPPRSLTFANSFSESVEVEVTIKNKRDCDGEVIDSGCASQPLGTFPENTVRAIHDQAIARASAAISKSRGCAGCTHGLKRVF